MKKSRIFKVLALIAIIGVLPTLSSCNKRQRPKKEQNLSKQALACYQSGFDYRFKNEDSSFYYFEKAFRFSSLNKNDTLTPYVLFRIATLHQRAFNYKEALQLFDSAMMEANRKKNYIIVSNCLNELGTIERDLNNLDQARTYLNKSLIIAEQFHLALQKGVILGNIANFESNPDSAMKYLDNAIYTLKQINGAELEYCTVLMNKANNISESKLAIKLYNEVINIAEKGQYSEALIGAYNNLACTYLECKEAKEAEECLRDHAIPEAINKKNIDWLSTLYESYAEIFEKKGDFHHAFEYQTKALKTRIEASQKQAASQMRLLDALFRAKNREIEIKEKTDEIKEKHDQLNTVYIWLFVLILLIILVVIVFLLWIQRKNLKLKIQEINTAKRLSAIEENEHAHLSMQIHDIIGPISSGLMKQIDRMDFPNREIKQVLLTRLSEATHELRRISHRLNPLMRDQMTFTELVRSIREDYQGRSDLIVNLQLPRKEPELSKDIVNQLYFILHELMMNARKYVKTGKVEISVLEELENLYILP